MNITVIGSINTDLVIHTDRMPEIGETIAHQEAYKTTVVDTTAAGDTFIGAFCMKMNEDTEYAVKYASMAASITVSRAGASKSIPSEQEVMERMKNL